MAVAVEVTVFVLGYPSRVTVLVVGCVHVYVDVFVTVAVVVRVDVGLE